MPSLFQSQTSSLEAWTRWAHERKSLDTTLHLQPLHGHGLVLSSPSARTAVLGSGVGWMDGHAVQNVTLSQRSRMPARIDILVSRSAATSESHVSHVDANSDAGPVRGSDRKGKQEHSPPLPHEIREVSRDSQTVSFRRKAWHLTCACGRLQI